MTRRKFIQQLLKIGATVIVGISWLAEKTPLRKFIRADSLGKYPGVVRPLKDINKQGKWSG
jgi:hypothetical protein